MALTDFKEKSILVFHQELVHCGAASYGNDRA
jgi:hypothetical protein